MNETTLALAQDIADIERSIAGLRIEVEGWRMHTGSTGEFILGAIDRLAERVRELKAAALK